jgi:hypothetical protein
VLIATLCALAALTGCAATASPAVRRSVHPFEGRFRDAATCGGGRFCGTGTLEGFGAVKTQLTLGPTLAGPEGCVGVAGTRIVTLASDAESTLRLSVRGAACGSRAWGTFTVASGTGVFAGATGSGEIIGTLSKSRGESLRFWGVLRLART